MFEQISTFFSIDMIYLWLNIGVIPFWFILIFLPNSRICSLFVSSIFPIIIFAAIYLYLIYFFYIVGYDFLINFTLYEGLNSLKKLFSEDGFLIIFWTHYLAINLFCGSWIVKDSQKLTMSKSFVFLPLITTYFIGPVGIFLYWIIRIFFAKRISLYD